VVFADADGAVFVPAMEVESVLATATAIGLTERAQADLIRPGSTIRDQLRFAEYLEAHAVDPSYTFRKHLRSIGGVIEE
jgi:4-hydroxy-4-methyl-2-oxoglutarate aldolase